MFTYTFGLQGFMLTMYQMSPLMFWTGPNSKDLLAWDKFLHVTSWGGPNVFMGILDWIKCLLIKRTCVLLCITQSTLCILAIC